MKIIQLLVLITFSLSSLYAQKNGTKDILLTALKDARLSNNKQLTNFAQSLKYHLPLVKQIEGRIGFNGSALGDSLYGYIRNEDFYGVEVSFNSLKQIKQQKQYKQAQISTLQSEDRILLQQALTERYQSLAEVYYIAQILKAYQKWDTLLSKKHEILKTMIERNLDVKVKDVMDTEGDKNTVQLTMLELDNDYHFHESKLQQFLDNIPLTEVDLTDFISIDIIAQVIENQKLIPSQHPTIDYRKAQALFAAVELDYVNSQNRQIFNMARVGWENPLYLEKQPIKKFNTLNNFSLRLGFTVPILGNNNFRRSEALLDHKEAQLEADWMAQQNLKAIDIQYVKLENLIKKYRVYKGNIEKNLIKKMLSNEKLLVQLTPLELIDMQLEQQKLELRILDVAQNITGEYLKLLDLKGTLSIQPFKNYLSASLEGF